MILDKPGRIEEDFYMVGPNALPVYLLNGDHPIIFDAGISCLGRLYSDEIKKYLGDFSPAFCLLTHSHFDHCGAASIFKNDFPGLSMGSSSMARAVFDRPSAVKLISYLNNAAAENAGVSKGSEFQPFDIDRVYKEGDVLEISNDLHVRVYNTPGHTRDCLSYYIPEKKILIASESLGIPDQTGYIYSDFLVDYDTYYDSMEKLSSLDIDAICFGHYYVYTGDDSKSFIKESMAHCTEFLHILENLLFEAKGDVKRVMNEVKKMEYDGKPEPKQPEAAYLLNLEARVKAVKKRIWKNKEHYAQPEI